MTEPRGRPLSDLIALPPSDPALMDQVGPTAGQSPAGPAGGPGPTAIWIDTRGMVLAAGTFGLRPWGADHVPPEGLKTLTREADLLGLLRAVADGGAGQHRVTLNDGRTLACNYAPAAPGTVELVAVDVSDLVQRGRDADRLFELSQDLVCVADLTGRFLRISPATASILGWSESELMARPFLDFVHPDDVDGTVAELNSLAAGTITKGFTNRYYTADHSLRSLQWAASPDTETGLIYAIARDVTEDLRLREQLQVARDAAESASRAKSAFLAHMSHELRTPLSAIIGYSEMILDEAQDGRLDAVPADVRTILDAGNQLLMLINGVLDVSKIEAGHVELFLEPIDVAELVAGVVATIRPAAERRNNRLTATTNVPIAIESDRLKLQQILLNLLSNATRFTQDGTVTLEVTTDETHVSFRISDDGIGMTPEELSRVFAPFEQASPAIGVRFGGTGLGLTIARRFAALLGGTVDVMSTPSAGSTFWVRVPIRTPELQSTGIPVTGGYLVIVPSTDRGARPPG